MSSWKIHISSKVVDPTTYLKQKNLGAFMYDVRWALNYILIVRELPVPFIFGTSASMTPMFPPSHENLLSI